MIVRAASQAAARGRGTRIVLADEVDAWPAGPDATPRDGEAVPDCACTAGTVCRHNNACPRLPGRCFRGPGES